MDLGIAGRRAAVAAASSGLGLASAKALAAEGVRVAICGRGKDRLDAAAAEIGGDCVALVADVSTADGGAAFVAAATEALGGVDILVTNAGGPPPGDFAATDVDAYPDALALNLLSVVGMCKAAAPAMQERGWGRVVAITSVAVRQPIANLILSNTARAGATGFLKTMARELAPTGVTVNSVQPGLHRTPRIVQLYGDDTPGPVGDPDDFGGVVAFLCSEQAKFLTGAAIHVDGGAYAALL
jgi:3-oxoacyl-[acyl-carrier protein] reductase